MWSSTPQNKSREDEEIIYKGSWVRFIVRPSVHPSIHPSILADPIFEKCCIEGSRHFASFTVLSSLTNTKELEGQEVQKEHIGLQQYNNNNFNYWKFWSMQLVHIGHELRMRRWWLWETHGRLNRISHSHRWMAMVMVMLEWRQGEYLSTSTLIPLSHYPILLSNIPHALIRIRLWDQEINPRLFMSITHRCMNLWYCAWLFEPWFPCSSSNRGDNNGRPRRARAHTDLLARSSFRSSSSLSSFWPCVSNRRMLGRS